MKKLYYASDIREEIKKKFQRDSVTLIEDTSIGSEKREKFAADLRTFKKYALEMVEEMESEEQGHEEEAT